MKKYARLNDESGAVQVVEAALVYPIVIFVVILFIFLGNLFYQQAKIDAIAVRGAEYLARMYSHPLLRGSTLPTNSTQVDVQPYRYLFGSSEAEAQAKEYVSELLNSTGSGMFSGMETNATIKTCKIKNYVVYQTACIEIEYSIDLAPIKLLGGISLFRCSSATVTAADDPAEFIRNIDMIMDYSDQLGLTKAIKEKVSIFFGN
ncbi:MAG: TadE family protein [Roseburia sp.]|nr:TadE family protein [Roseburia sp.]